MKLSKHAEDRFNERICSGVEPDDIVKWVTNSPRRLDNKIDCGPFVAVVENDTILTVLPRASTHDGCSVRTHLGELGRSLWVRNLYVGRAFGGYRKPLAMPSIVQIEEWLKLGGALELSYHSRVFGPTVVLRSPFIRSNFLGRLSVTIFQESWSGHSYDGQIYTDVVAIDARGVEMLEEAGARLGVVTQDIDAREMPVFGQ